MVDLPLNMSATSIALASNEAREEKSCTRKMPQQRPVCFARRTNVCYEI
jgi:hypothetical protein